MNIISLTELLTLHKDIFNSHLSLVLSCSSRQNKICWVCGDSEHRRMSVNPDNSEQQTYCPWTCSCAAVETSPQNHHSRSVFTSANKVLHRGWIRMEHLHFPQPHGVVNLWPQQTHDFLTISHICAVTIFGIKIKKVYENVRTLWSLENFYCMPVLHHYNRNL